MTKVCSKCGRELPIDEFYIRKASNDGRDYKCKDCARKYSQSRRDNYPELTKEIARRTREKNRERINKRQRDQYAIDRENPEYMEKRRQYARDFQNPKNKLKRMARKDLLNNSKPPCAKCGETRGYVLQYHHIDPETKLISIGANCARDAKLIESEIKKCVCLCANCHKEFHHFYGARPRDPIGSLEEYLEKPIPSEQMEAIKEYYLSKEDK